VVNGISRFAVCVGVLGWHPGVFLFASAPEEKEEDPPYLPLKKRAAERRRVGPRAPSPGQCCPTVEPNHCVLNIPSAPPPASPPGTLLGPRCGMNCAGPNHLTSEIAERQPSHSFPPSQRPLSSHPLHSRRMSWGRGHSSPPSNPIIFSALVIF